MDEEGQEDMDSCFIHSMRRPFLGAHAQRLHVFKVVRAGVKALAVA